jgi:hypothetical protein
MGETRGHTHACFGDVELCDIELSCFTVYFGRNIYVILNIYWSRHNNSL